MTVPFRSSFRSIRGKLTLAAVAPLVMVLILVALAASYLINASIVGQAQKQIHNDLNAAKVVLEQEMQRLHEVVRFSARSTALLTGLRETDLEKLSAELAAIRQREQIDVFNITDLQGRSLLGAADDNLLPAPDYALQALETGHYHGTVLFSESELHRESAELAARARIFGPLSDKVLLEQRGIFLVAAIRLVDQRGDAVGCLYGGIMLNNNQALVDRIRELVYGPDQFDGTAVGSATIFLDKLRVATTIRMQDGQRALGTQVSQEVARAVLQRGETWLARARVVDDWYLTAYEPIVDDRSKPIGALYVGLLERPFVAVKQRSYLILFGLLVFGCLLGGLLSGFLARRLSRPVLELAGSAEKIAAGERDVPLPVGGQDEVGHLADAFAKMAGALKESDAELQELNRQLEKKVDARTSELEVKSMQLIKTQEQLLRHEKLAAIGSLATGVAHEINNPAAIIRGNVEILQMSLAEEAPEQEETREIMKQVERVSLITKNLLTFAGKQEFAAEQVELNPLLDDILTQISHQQPLGEVEVERNFSEIPPIPGDRERLRQVFTNIILNALQSMQGEGVLSLSSRVEKDSVVVRVADTGLGIPGDLKEKVFNPFFTTKKRGTGLGLSVSYGIVQAHEGEIELLDDVSAGACFQVTLPT